MPTVDDNRLKANYGAATVMKRLSISCLVRPVPGDTDVGIDLFCETVEDKTPRLHFWVQVKSGLQCKVNESEHTASISLDKDDLLYWVHQPVPVFVALVPTDWPPESESEQDIYLIDVSTTMIFGVHIPGKSITLTSNLHWPASDQKSVSDFVKYIIPSVSALLQIRYGVISQIPTLSPSYLQSTPPVPVLAYQRLITKQVRVTSAMAIINLLIDGIPDKLDHAYHRQLARVLAQYDGDQHWETWAAQGLSHHADQEFALAVERYSKAISLCESDPQFGNNRRFLPLLNHLRKLRDSASKQEQMTKQEA